MEGLQARVAERAATHNTWRQMKGMDRIMYEVSVMSTTNLQGYKELSLTKYFFLSPLLLWHT